MVGEYGEAMKTPVWIFFSLLLLILAGCGLFVSTAKSFDTATIQQLDQIMAESMAAYQAPGMILWVYDPNKGEYFKAVGTAELSTGKPMNASYLYRIGSLTKTFTGTVVLQMIDEGQLALGDHVSKYISGVPSGESITIRMLLNMTSGLAEYMDAPSFQELYMSDPMRQWTPQELISYSFIQPTYFPPGTGFHYSNTNTVLLGMIIEKLSGRKLEQEVKTRIFDFLGMSHSSFPISEIEIPGEYIHGYYQNGATLEDWSVQNVSSGWAAGAIISNIYDIKTYIKAVGDGTFLSPALQQERFADGYAYPVKEGYPPHMHYCLAGFSAEAFVGHNGSLPGYNNIAVYNPQDSATITLMFNIQPTMDATVPTFYKVYKAVYPERI